MLEKVWRKGNSPVLLVGISIGTVPKKNSSDSLKKLKIELPYDPGILLLGIYLGKTII